MLEDGAKTYQRFLAADDCSSKKPICFLLQWIHSRFGGDYQRRRARTEEQGGHFVFESSTFAANSLPMTFTTFRAQVAGRISVALPSLLDYLFPFFM